MKIIIIDNNENFAEALSKKLKAEKFCEDKIVFNNIVDLCVVADKVKEQAKPNDILFINCELQSSSSNRQYLNGIEILKWLRLKEINNHCILYSFFSNTQIIKENPLNGILHSKGVTFLQAPFSISAITSSEKKELSNKENLLPFFRAEVDLNKVRHEMANIWGLNRLKWLLNLPDENLSNNISFERLKYLHPKINQNNPLDKSKFDKIAKWFDDKSPTIFYYDDLADQWGPVLKKMLSKNFKFFNPKQTTKKVLLEMIEAQKPKCLLLDLRLQNETDYRKNPLDFSGGKLLMDLKRNHFTLPVIMFTATNKAESVRKLLAAGSEYVWTKEGVDEGISDNYTLVNTVDLLNEIKKCVFKFSNETYEKIFEAESKINRTYFADGGIVKKLESGGLKDIKTFVFDTNFFLDSLKQEDFLTLFYKFLLANKQLGSNEKKVVIHEDVYNEIFSISKQNEKSAGNEYRVPVARLLIRLLYSWTKNRLVQTPYNDGQTAAIKEVVEFDISETLTPFEEIQLEEKTFFERVTAIFKQEQSEQIVKLNDQIEKFNKGLTTLPEFKKIKLHADDTFKVVLPKYLSEGNTILVTNDNTCAYHVGQLFVNGTSLKKKIYKCKFDINNRDAITEIEGIQNATVNGFTYQQLFNTDFTKLFS